LSGGVKPTNHACASGFSFSAAGDLNRSCRVDVIGRPPAFGRHHGYAAVAHGRDARALVDVETDVALCGQPGLTRVQAHAHAQRADPTPLLSQECVLTCQRGGHGIGGADEDGEQRVAFTAWPHDHAVMAVSYTHPTLPTTDSV